MNKSLEAMLAGVICMLLCACGARSGSSSLRYLHHAKLGPSVAPGLVVMLPGFGDRASHFERHAFVETARAQGGWDVVAVDAHFGYYRSGEVVERLRQDIIGPARALGYRNIWLVGVSMGGFGATSYASRYPEDISGLILVSPYLGEHDGNLSAIKAALATQRKVRTSSTPPSQVELRVWNYLARKAKETPRRLFLIYGSEENDAAHARLAALLDKERVHIEPGGHKWHVWRAGFDKVSERALATKSQY